MAASTKVGSTKRSTKGSGKTKAAQSSSSSGPKKRTGAKPVPSQHKPKPRNVSDKPKKPPHLRYTEKELKVPQLNGIRPAGVQKRPNAKKGKTFVDDRESMNTILALVMAEKEGNIESKMIKARQMEEVREARRVEAEKRAQSKKQSLEDRKDEIKQSKNKRRRSESDNRGVEAEVGGPVKKVTRKRVSFG